MQVRGKIIQILPISSGISQRDQSQWMSQDFVLETTGERYPKKMVFNVFGKDRLDKFQIKTDVEYDVYFDINASEYKGKWYNSVRAYDVRQVIDNSTIPVTVHTADGGTEVQGLPFPGVDNNNDNLGY